MHRILFAALAMLLVTSSAFAQWNDQMCRERALDAYDRVYDDCMGSGQSCRFDRDCSFDQRCVAGRCTSGGSGCSYYTQHGEYACRDHQGCSWSYFSSQCYDLSGRTCAYYTNHGEYACRDNAGCNWSYTSNQCYDR